MQGIGEFLGQLFGPIGNLFHYVFFEPIYNILILIYQVLHAVFPAGAFPLAIVILTVLIRCALIPLTRRQLQSTRKMQMLQPQLKELQARYRGDPQRLMREQQALYRENGVSMYGGCLPLLVQMPFLYALFFSFNELLHDNLAKINSDLYPFVPKLTQPLDPHFLWTSLTTPDPYHILPILAGILTFFQLRMAMPYRKKEPGAQADVMTQSTQTTQYIMPFVTVFIGWAVPSGLALYWTISTAFSAIQQYFISGWGSFWVGIPGMEHMVKEQTLPTTTVKPASPTAGSARALTPASTAPPAEGGLRGWWRKMRETATVMSEQRMREREEADQASAKGSTNGQSANGTSASATSGTNRDRRERRVREGPVLVKPSQPAPDAVDAAIAEATSQAELPETEIARAASSDPNASNGNGTSNRNGASNGDGSASLAASTSSNNTRPAANGTARPASSGN
ncbi:MAG TPA: YidC/Oxa1 family membrane protein insertase, partial [Ktedonobacterales bacterium]|nr:YidC/Oxa1 family membrane protein insertase [Ktedonobacterales bacterium]